MESKQSGKHLINHDDFHINRENQIFAGKCNCGDDAHHLIFTGEVDWENTINLRTVKALEKLPIREIIFATQYY